MLLLIAPSHLQFRPTIERFSGKLKDLLSNFIQILVILSIVGTSIGVSNSAAVAANLSQDDVKDQPELSTQTAIGSPRDQSSIQSNELSIHSKDSEQALSTTQSEENESRIWAGTTNAGIWVYENNAWSHRSNGIESSSVNNLAVNPNNRDNLLAVVGRNVYRTNDAGMSWHKVSMPITQDGWNRIFWDRATPGEVVISGPDLGEVWDAKPVAAISHDAGVSWRGIPLGTREGELGQGFPGDVWGLDGVWYIIGNSALNLYFVPCTMHAMWRSFNHGGFWELTCEWPRGRWQTERFITGRWTDPAHLYGAYTHSYANLLVESGNAGDNWAAGDQAFHSARQFLSDPVREGDLWLVAHNHLYHSSTGISGFSRADTLDTNAWAVAVDGYQGTVYTAGDYRRVAYSLDLGDSWTRIDLPRVDPVTDNTHVRFLAAELPPIISLPDRSDLSDCETKDQQGDPRECQVNGAGNTQGYAGDPINTQTGGFHTISNDLSFNTAAGPLTFQRTYSSRAIDLYTETLGYGWTHNHDTHLIFPDDPGGEEGILWFKAHTANQYRFTIIGDGEYKPYPGVLGTLHLEDGPPVRYILTDRAQQTYTFDEDGKLLTWTNAVGNGFHYQYDGEGRLSKVSDDSASRYLTYTYDGQSRINSVIDHTGRSLTFTYNASGDLETMTDLLDGVWNYTYDGSHRLTHIQDPRGITSTRVEYDEQGRADEQFNGLNLRTAGINYGENGVTTIQDPLNHTTTHVYDEEERTLIQEIDHLGGVTQRTYDNNLRPASVTNPLGDTNYLEWSDDGHNLERTIDPLGYATEMFYNATNRFELVRDPLNRETEFNYTGALLDSIEDALENTTSFGYTTGADAPQPPGLMKLTTDALGYETEFSYNAYGDRIQMIDTLDQNWTYDYDNLGRLTSATDPYGIITRYQYDDAD